jgi:hypothetical protein
MVESSPVEMTAEEITSFVADHGTGVLALPAGEQPYAVPISYAFDAETDEFLVRLGHLDDSERDRYLEESTPARMVVYDQSGPSSIIADGTLVEVDKSALTADTIRVLGDGETPAFELWEQGKADLEITIHRLVDTELTGRKPAGD